MTKCALTPVRTCPVKQPVGIVGWVEVRDPRGVIETTISAWVSYLDPPYDLYTTGETPVPLVFDAVSFP